MRRRTAASSTGQTHEERPTVRRPVGARSSRPGDACMRGAAWARGPRPYNTHAHRHKSAFLSCVCPGLIYIYARRSFFLPLHHIQPKRRSKQRDALSGLIVSTYAVDSCQPPTVTRTQGHSVLLRAWRLKPQQPYLPRGRPPPSWPLGPRRACGGRLGLLASTSAARHIQRTE